MNLAISGKKVIKLNSEKQSFVKAFFDDSIGSVLQNITPLYSVIEFSRNNLRSILYSSLV